MDQRGEILDVLCRELRALMGEAQHHSDAGDGAIRVQDCLRRMHVSVANARLALAGPLPESVKQARIREDNARARAPRRKVANG